MKKILKRILGVLLASGVIFIGVVSSGATFREGIGVIVTIYGIFVFFAVFIWCFED